MKRKSDHEVRHVVDTLFVFLLFSLFTLCSIFLIAFGANIYKRTVSNFDEHYNITTSAAYIMEKFRQCDSKDCFTAVQFGDGDALRISSVSNDTEYYTYIYEDEGYLKELYTKADNILSPGAGQRLLEIDTLKVVPMDDGHYKIALVDKKSRVVSFMCSSKCDY